MTEERKISKATALDELSGLFEQVAADPGGGWLNGGHADTLGWAAETLTDFEARVRAEVAEEIALAIERECEDIIGDGYVDGLNGAAGIARLAAGSSPDTTPKPRAVRRGRLTEELTDQERYEIEAATAATYADREDS